MRGTLSGRMKKPNLTIMLLLLSAFLCVMLIKGAMADIKVNKGNPAQKVERTAGKKTTGKRFKDWALQCGGKGLKDDQRYITQNIFIQESGLRLLAVAIGYLGPDGTPRLFFTLPLGILLPPGMAFNIDGGEEIKVPIRVCLPDGCKAGVQLDKKLLNAWKKGLRAKVAFLDGKTQQQIIVEVSLGGFTKAFAALQKKPAH